MSYIHYVHSLSKYLTMTLQEISEIKTQFPDLILQKDITGMFDSIHWGCAFAYDIIMLADLTKLCDYCRSHRLCLSIGHRFIHIQ